MPYVLPATEDHIRILAQTMREEDKREILAASGMTPEASLQGCLGSSRVCKAFFTDEGDLAGVYGVTENPTNPRLGHPWMLASDHLLSIQVTFLRQSREHLAELEEGFDLLMNLCDKRNTVHIKWLRWLGFVFLKEHPKFGVGQIPFLEFVKIGKNHV